MIRKAARICEPLFLLCQDGNKKIFCACYINFYVYFCTAKIGIMKNNIR